MIDLEKEKPFGHGSHREVYRHPDKPGRCLKVMVEDWRECDRRKRTHWLSRTFRPKWYFHESESELRFSEELRRRVGEEAWNYVAQAYGFVETDLGEALEVDLITDHDGEIALSLKQYVWEFGMTKACEEAIEEFWRGLDQHWIFVQGRPDNVSILRAADGSCQCRAIDGYGLAHLIPVAKWLPPVKRNVLQKRRAKQKRFFEKLLSRKASGEEIGSDGFRL